MQNKIFRLHTGTSMPGKIMIFMLLGLGAIIGLVLGYQTIVHYMLPTDKPQPYTIIKKIE